MKSMSLRRGVMGWGLGGPGAARARRAAHGEAVTQRSAPTPGHALCIWALQSIFVRVPGIPASCLIAIKALAGPMLLPERRRFPVQTCRALLSWKCLRRARILLGGIIAPSPGVKKSS